MSSRSSQGQNSGSIVILGEHFLSGSYVLRLDVRDRIAVCFGKFRGGVPISVPAGTYVYVGSAMSGLAHRLLRHATRTGDQRPHAIRAQMLSLFRTIGLVGTKFVPNSRKRLHWHIDHLLDRTEVCLSRAVLVRSHERLESAIARYLEDAPQTFLLEEGLGATDSPGSTHLLGLTTRDGNTWWDELPALLQSHFPKI